MSRLHIGIDGRNLLLAEGTGVATYGRVLLDCIERLGAAVELVVDTARTPIGRPDHPSDRASSSPVSARIRRYLRVMRRTFPLATLPPAAYENARERALLERFAHIHAAPDIFRAANLHLELFRRPISIQSEHPPALMHWTYPLPIRLRGAVNIYTVHDLIPLRFPGQTNIDQAGFRRLVTNVVRHADHIVTVSETSRRDIIDLLGCPPEKVTNTYQALDLAQRAPPKSRSEIQADVAAALGLPLGGYLLYVGSIEARKNVRGLIEAYLASTTRLPLVLAGPDGWRADEQLAGVRDRIVKAPLQDGASQHAAIVRLPYLAYPTLLSILAGARALLFPSLVEGFGLPILEAMTLGVPVVTSNVGAMAEIAGSGARLVDPGDPHDLARAIRAVSDDAALCSDLAARGRNRAAAFSLESYTDRLGRLYRDLVAQKRVP